MTTTVDMEGEGGGPEDWMRKRRKSVTEGDVDGLLLLIELQSCRVITI